MFKKLTAFFVFAILVMGCWFSTYANGDTGVSGLENEDLSQELNVEDTLFKDKDIEDTEQFLVTITRPEGDESTFRKSYIVCGNSVAEKITVKLYMYDEEAESFMSFENTEGENSWGIGYSGFFIKEIELPNIGANRMRIAAFKSEDKELALGTNAQVNTFTVTLLDNEVKNSMRNGFFNINQMLMRIFGT